MAERERVFLMYHELERPGRTMCQSDPGYARYVVSENDFRSQMCHLQQGGWSALTVTQALSPATPAQAVVITFDDGSETDLLSAAPALHEAHFGATFYITLGFVDQRGYLSVSQLRELSNQPGFEIGCHSITHRYLTDVDESRLHTEIGVAKDELEQIIGRPVEHFSCPGGRWNHRVAEVARQVGYRSVATSRISANGHRSDHFALGRVAVMRGISLDAFSRICRGQGLWRMQLNDLARSTVKRVMGNSTYDRIRDALLHHPIN
jgi:peptidoglycan/xylan/chitin deacetylase (PgdA/CDA1 family)